MLNVQICLSGCAFPPCVPPWAITHTPSVCTLLHLLRWGTYRGRLNTEGGQTRQWLRVHVEKRYIQKTDGVLELFRDGAYPAGRAGNKFRSSKMEEYRAFLFSAGTRLGLCNLGARFAVKLSKDIATLIQGWILQEFMPGTNLYDDFKRHYASNCRIILQQLAHAFILLQ